MFVVSQDCSSSCTTIRSTSPTARSITTSPFPKPGMYRVLGDFYPDGATPQLIAKTVMVPGAAPAPAPLARTIPPRTRRTCRSNSTTDPPQPIAGMKTLLYFNIKPAEGFEKYLGAWGHMLVASDDLIDLIHTHPFIADGGPQIQFNVTFPRARGRIGFGYSSSARASSTPPTSTFPLPS